MCKSELFKLFNKLWFVTLLLAVFIAGCGHWDSPPLSRSLVSIAVMPANPTVVASLTKQFTAIGTYSDGTSFDITPVVIWTSGTTAVATVLSTSGLATGLTAGTSMITAVSGTISGSTLLTVTAAPLVSISVTPANPSIAKDTTQQFTAIGDRKSVV